MVIYLLWNDLRCRKRRNDVFCLSEFWVLYVKIYMCCMYFCVASSMIVDEFNLSNQIKCSLCASIVMRQKNILRKIFDGKKTVFSVFCTKNKLFFCLKSHFYVWCWCILFILKQNTQKHVHSLFNYI